MNDKMVGYSLITLGLAIIIFALISIVSIIRGGVHAPEYFNFEGISIDTAQIADVSVPDELENAGVKVQPKASNPQEIVPADLLNKTTNLFIHIILMGFVVNVGFKISMIGTSLSRPVMIRTKRDNKFETELKNNTNV